MKPKEFNGIEEMERFSAWFAQWTEIGYGHLVSGSDLEKARNAAWAGWAASKWQTQEKNNENA